MAVGLVAGILFGFAGTLSAFIDGMLGLIAGPLTGVAVGIIAAQLSRTRESSPGCLLGAVSAAVSWGIGCVLLPWITWLVAAVATLLFGRSVS